MIFVLFPLSFPNEQRFLNPDIPLNPDWFGFRDPQILAYEIIPI